MEWDRVEGRTDDIFDVEVEMQRLLGLCAWSVSSKTLTCPPTQQWTEINSQLQLFCVSVCPTHPSSRHHERTRSAHLSVIQFSFSEHKNGTRLYTKDYIILWK